MFVFIITLLTLPCGLYGSPQPRRKCDRCDENFACDCSSSNLQEVPAISTTSVITLDLSFNDIKSIGQDDFFDYSILQVLILRRNMISSIAKKGFSTLSKLEVLDLSDNQLSNLSEMWFEHLSSLKHLNLLGNKYEKIGEGPLFRSVAQLSILMVGNQFLASVSKDNFIGPNHLQSFVFYGNNLRNYQPGSFSQINLIDEVTISIAGPFQNNTNLTTDILKDLSHPETKMILSDLRINRWNLLPFQVIFQKGVKNILLRNLSCNVDTITDLFSMTNMSALTSIGMEDSEFNGDPTLHVEFPELYHISEIYMKNVKLEKFYVFPALICGNFLCPAVLRLVSGLKRLIIIDSNFFAMPCIQSWLFIHLEYLDITRNQFSDLTLPEAFCHGESLPNLVAFNVSSNYLKSFDILGHLFKRMTKMVALDASLNVFHTMPQVCAWPQTLRFLNLSSCHLQKVTSCLPQTLHILDLSYNDLIVFEQNLPDLTELYLSGNRLKTLPDGKLFAHLEVLYIKDNPLISFSKKQLSDYGVLRILEASTDTFVCSCEFVDFFNHELSHLVSLKDRRQAYCSSPFALRGTKVTDAQLSVFECHAALAFSTLCVLVVLVVIGIMVTCHKLHVLWYLQMTWAWLQAKRRPVAREDQVCYDAFVSYSERDEEWVEELLVPELEGAQTPFRLCLHKRDFLPGGWIADSIMAAMEKSHRILFIVSQNFVQSDWCRLELEYSHFRLFDAGILILLEPIPESSIPKRFCKLRKVMNSRTYLEWPEEESERSRFWQALKDTLDTA